MSVYESERTAGRRLKLWLWVAGAVVLAMTAWVAVDLLGTPTVPAGVDEAIDDYLAAWADEDPDALRAVTADLVPTFVLNEFIYQPELLPDGTERVRLAIHTDDHGVDDIIDGAFPLTEWMPERVGDPTITGDGPWFVSFAEDWIEDGTWEETRLEGMATYVVVEEADGFKVANHYWAGLAFNVPKD